MLGSFAYLALVMPFDPPGIVIVRIGVAMIGAMVVLVIAFATTMVATPKSTSSPGRCIKLQLQGDRR